MVQTTALPIQSALVSTLVELQKSIEALHVAVVPPAPAGALQGRRLNPSEQATLRIQYGMLIEIRDTLQGLLRSMDSGRITN